MSDAPLTDADLDAIEASESDRENVGWGEYEYASTSRNCLRLVAEVRRLRLSLEGREKALALLNAGMESQAAEYSRLKQEARGLAERVGKLERAIDKMDGSICQSLGKALGYPRYCDDQGEFPGATEADGVCVGEHVAESLAVEAAEQITALRQQVAGLAERVAQQSELLSRHAERGSVLGQTGDGARLSGRLLTERVITPPGAAIEAKVVEIPESIQRAISASLERGKREAQGYD